jgi:Fe-S cluster biosynthesis and repair protein YggX
MGCIKVVRETAGKDFSDKLGDLGSLLWNTIYQTTSNAKVRDVYGT